MSKSYVNNFYSLEFSLVLSLFCCILLLHVLDYVQLFVFVKLLVISILTLLDISTFDYIFYSFIKCLHIQTK